MGSLLVGSLVVVDIAAVVATAEQVRCAHQGLVSPAVGMGCHPAGGTIGSWAGDLVEHHKVRSQEGCYRASGTET